MNSLVCPNCQVTLVEPVLLPCCHTVCRKHETEGPTLRCGLCQVKHEVLCGKGFPANLIVQTLLDNDLENADLGSEHRVATGSLKDIKMVVDELIRLQERPEFEINRVVNDLKNKIELRNESAKQAIDKEATVLLVKLEDFEKKCIASLSTAKNDLIVSDENKKLLKTLKTEKIPFWENVLTRFKRNTKQYKAFHEDMITSLEIMFPERDRLRQIIFNDELVNLQLEKRMFCKENIEPIL